MKLRVHVVMGGPSAEYEISLISGHQVLLHLDTNKYDVRVVIITQDRRYYTRNIQPGAIPSLESIRAPGELAPPYASTDFSGPFSASDSMHLWKDCDVAFLALHGEFGEDGRFQGFLDTLGIPYNGSGVFASALAMQKIMSKYVFLQNGLDTPPFSVYGKNNPETTIEYLELKHGFPCFVKCPQSGSSRLLGRAVDSKSLIALLQEFEPHADDILVESSISGIEFTCPVLEYPDGSIKALLPIEIRPKVSEFFDYEAKYSSMGSEELVPAPRSADILAEIQRIALKTHTALGCRGVSRTDIIYSCDTYYVLEVNTLPGLTTASLLPKSFAAAGGTYQELLDILITTAQNRS
jgi:D-alanine-D-alanine ligase